MVDKELIKKWGENSAFSAKGHFKSADLKRFWINFLVLINLFFALFSLLDLGWPLATKIFGSISLIASILVLLYESQNDHNSVNKHMAIGDEYLQLHYELQKLHYTETISNKQFEEVSGHLKVLNLKEKPIIGQIARKWAKHAIERNNEMTKWWNE